MSSNNELEVFAVKDDKADIFGTPIFQRNTPLAIRAFEQEVNNVDSMLSRFPRDFHLYRIGLYEITTGCLTSETPPLHITSAQDCVKQTELPLENGVID